MRRNRSLLMAHMMGILGMQGGITEIPVASWERKTELPKALEDKFEAARRAGDLEAIAKAEAKRARKKGTR